MKGTKVKEPTSENQKKIVELMLLYDINIEDLGLCRSLNYLSEEIAIKKGTLFCVWYDIPRGDFHKQHWMNFIEQKIDEREKDKCRY